MRVPCAYVWFGVDSFVVVGTRRQGNNKKGESSLGGTTGHTGKSKCVHANCTNRTTTTTTVKLDRLMGLFAFAFCRPGWLLTSLCCHHHHGSIAEVNVWMCSSSTLVLCEWVEQFRLKSCVMWRVQAQVLCPVWTRRIVTFNERQSSGGSTIKQPHLESTKSMQECRVCSMFVCLFGRHT